MDSSPVSAFAVYRTSFQPKDLDKPKRKRKQKKPRAESNVMPVVHNNPVTNVAEKIPEVTIKQAAEKVKKKLKKVNENKVIGKKKTNKEKKNRVLKQKNKDLNERPVASTKNLKENNEDLNKRPKTSTKTVLRNAEDVPDLVPAQMSNGLGHHGSDESDACSHSSAGSFEFTPVETDSSEEGLKVFKWMIAPYDPDEFLNRVWEKKPLHISRKKPTYYSEVISTPLIDGMLRNESIQFTKNIDITSYVDGKRETHNPEGRAHPHLVWDFYLNGCSIRLLNPQTYIPKLHLINATMQEFFNSFVGANAYLTPPDSQGFAPHYDDIEAFILQAEGKKHWKIYKPLEENEVLPRVSSKNFDQEEIGEPIMEVTLEAGDMLYFPRGYIHQGVTIDGEHSLHVTVSMYQKHSWADLFEKLIPAALQMAITENVDLRRGLPFDMYDHFGLVHSDSNTPRRIEIKELIESLFDKIKDHLPIDEAVDQINKNYQHDALPPVLSDLEKAVTVHGDTDVMIENGKVINRVELGLDTRIRLLRKNILRMVSEESIRLYYHTENSLEYHGNELSYLEIEEDMAPAVETLIMSYPEYVAVESLDIPNDSDKLQIADALWSRGLIMTEYPLETLEDD